MTVAATASASNSARTSAGGADNTQRSPAVPGSTLRGRSNEFKALLADQIAAKVWPLVESGALRPAMDRIVPLAEAAAAHARMEAGAHIGKIILKV